MTTVAALYVDPKGVYSGLEGVEVWDEERDARLYPGPWPVVAHPPCQRWCKLAKQVEQRFGCRVGDDGGCFAAALDAVRTYGGVLEHPARSLAWAAHDLPEPRSTGGWTQSFFDEGYVAYVEQGRYGLPMRKATWLYAYRVELPKLHWGSKPDSELGEFKWGSYLYKDESNHSRPRLQKSIMEQTPEEFRDILLAMARSASRELADAAS